MHFELGNLVVNGDFSVFSLVCVCVLVSVVMACQSVANIAKTSLGPVGLDKVPSRSTTIWVLIFAVFHG